MKTIKRISSLISHHSSFERKIGNFTLIELLVVVAIIAILAGMLLPALNNARKRSSEIKCTGNLRQIYPALLEYCADYDEVMPFTGEWEQPIWRRVLYSYLYKKTNDSAADSAEIYTCPEWKTTALAMKHGMDPWIKTWYYNSNANLKYYKMNRIAKPTLVGMLMDGTASGGCHNFGAPSLGKVGWRHVSKNANFLFCDGHVQTYRYTGNADHVKNLFKLDQ